MIRNVLVPTSLAMLITLGVGGNCNADLVAYWNFNTYDGDALSISPTTGSGNITITGFTSGNVTNGNTFGSTINVRNADPADDPVIFQNNFAGAGDGSDWFDITVNLTGLQDPIVTWASQRNGPVPGGFLENDFLFSTGGAFTEVVSDEDPGNPYSLKTYDLSSFDALDGAANVTFRYRFGGASNGAGMRLDNVQVNATAIPEASAFLFGGLICGVVGLLKCGRRSRVEQGGCED